MRNFKGYAALSATALAGVLLAGCATSGTIQSREQERPAAYAALSPDTQALVDQGKIKTGMNEDAVYLAWGNPQQRTEGENEIEHTTTWTYYRSYLQPVSMLGLHRVYYNYYPVNYASAQVVFTNGIVKRWQTFPAPGFY
jgi:hypothetical protein